jgi:AcrR family transcriptional regulator
MSPRTPAQNLEIREEKKTLIMDVALRHFADEGFYKTTISHIAKHAGISKGLMYNYFESKESLLIEIITRSVSEVYEYFDLDKDGYLSEEEFEFFVRRMLLMLKEKKSFWRLIFQLLMQKEVRELFNISISSTESGVKPEIQRLKGMLGTDITKTITEYFIRKKGFKGPEYDPSVEMNMFNLTLKGFALTYIYMDQEDEEIYEKTINRLIRLYK